MKAWGLLYLAIIFEVIATSALKASDSFSKLVPSVIVIFGYGLAFYLLSITLRTIPTGVAYAVWSGVGIVLITVISWIMFAQKLNLTALVGIAFIIAGALILNLFANIGK